MGPLNPVTLSPVVHFWLSKPKVMLAFSYGPELKHPVGRWVWVDTVFNCSVNRRRQQL